MNLRFTIRMILRFTIRMILRFIKCMSYFAYVNRESPTCSSSAKAQCYKRLERGHDNTLSFNRADNINIGYNK